MLPKLDRPYTIEDFISMNALNARLYAWMQSVDITKQTGGSKYAFVTKRSDWDGKPYDWNTFVDAYWILEKLEQGSELSFVLFSEREIRYEKGGVHVINNPVYFTYAVIYAYLKLDERFKQNSTQLKGDLQYRLRDMHAEAFESLEKLISDELSHQAEVDIAVNAEDAVADSVQEAVQMQEQELTKQETRNADMEAELKDLKKKNKMSDKEMMGFYFCKIATEYLEKNKKKKLEVREKAKENLQSIMNSLRLHKYVSDELQEAIDTFDNEETTNSLIFEGNVGMVVGHANTIETKK